MWPVLSSNPHTVNTSVIYCNLRRGLSTLELNEYCIALYSYNLKLFTKNCGQTAADGDMVTNDCL